MAQAWLLTGGECLVYLLTLVCVCLGIRGNILIYKCRAAMFIQKRNQTILFGWNVSCLILMLLGSLLTFARFHPEVPFLTIIGDPLGVVCYALLFHFAIARQWMIRFNQVWTYYTLEAEWRNILTETSQKAHWPWFIRNRNRYGNAKWMNTAFGVYQVCGCLFGVTGSILYNLGYDRQITDTMAGVPILLNIAFYYYLVMSTRSPCRCCCWNTPWVLDSNDVFFIAWELKWGARLLLVMTTAFLVFTFALSMAEEQQNEVFQKICYIVFYCVLVLNTYGLHHVSTYFMFFKNIKGTGIATLRAKSVGSVSTATTPSSFGAERVAVEIAIHNGSNQEPGNGSPTSAGRQRYISMERVLASSDTLHLFVLHLSNEFSLEIILSLIEMEQYQRYCLAMLSAEQIEESGYHQLVFASAVPECAILSAGSADDKNNDYKWRAYKIYCKYMSKDSEYQINISYKMTSVLAGIFGDVEKLGDNNEIRLFDIFLEFEKVKKEMLTLLKYSFGRFKGSEPWARVEAKFYGKPK